MVIYILLATSNVQFIKICILNLFQEHKVYSLTLNNIWNVMVIELLMEECCPKEYSEKQFGLFYSWHNLLVKKEIS